MAPIWAGPGLLKVIFGCILKKSKNESFEQAHSAEKSERDRTLRDFFKIHSVGKYQKMKRGFFGDIIKYQKKVSAEKHGISQWKGN